MECCAWGASLGLGQQWCAGTRILHACHCSLMQYHAHIYAKHAHHAVHVLRQCCLCICIFLVISTIACLAFVRCFAPGISLLDLHQWLACSAQLLPPSATATASDAAGILVWFSELSWLDQSVAGYYAALVVLLQAWQASHHDGYVVWVGCGSFLSQIPWIVHAVQVTVSCVSVGPASAWGRPASW
jgi:hypothetical protein